MKNLFILAIIGLNLFFSSCEKGSLQESDFDKKNTKSSDLGKKDEEKTYKIYCGLDLLNKEKYIERKTKRQDLENFFIEEMIRLNDIECYNNLKFLNKKGKETKNKDLLKELKKEDIKNFFEIKNENGDFILNFKRKAYIPGDMNITNLNLQIKKTFSQIDGFNSIKIAFEGDFCWNGLNTDCFTDSLQN